MMTTVSEHLATNVKQLREARGFTQHQSAKVAGIPRPTWATLESGEANPTLAVLVKVAAALQVSLEELVSPPRASCELFQSGSLPTRNRGGITVREMLPDSFIGIQIERLEMRAGANMKGVPHTPGTREYLICDKGSVQLAAAGESWELGPGDVLVFRGDQKHSYRNTARGETIAYSVIVLGATAQP